MNRLFKFLFTILIFAGNGAYAQCPSNIGFEDGSFTNWEAYAGDVLPNGTIDVSSTGPVYNRHTIEVAGGVDKYGGFPTVSPNGSKYSVRLGNDGVIHQAERLSYTFTVPLVQQYSLVLNYAVVLQNPNHPEFEQPRFRVTVFNLTDNEPVDCPAFDFYATSDRPGFKLSDVVVGGTVPAEVYYKDWSATTIDLSAYAGKKIRLEFTTNDCARMGHFGYAYFDLNEDCKQSITGNTYCAGQTTVTLQGPRGFSNYTWYNEDMSQELGHEQTLKLDPAPPNGTKFVLAVSALPGLGCTGIINTTIVKSSAPFVFKAKSTINMCGGTSIDLTAASITEGSMAGLAFEYFKDPVTLEYLRDPTKITEQGIYYIQATSTEGCINILPVEIKWYDAVDFTPTDPAPVQHPAKIDLSSTYVKQPGYNYFFYSDAKATKVIDDYRNISTTGKYYIKAVSAPGCEKTVAVTVTITPPPPYLISAPTAFTPNNDGINDLFNITIKGFVDFGTLSIYNRSGQFLYKTNKQAANWDGNFGGRPLSAGTYYWLFEGTDSYYHTKVTKSGYVSIIK
jgi:gliding motility-associated-like protein